MLVKISKLILFILSVCIYNTHAQFIYFDELYDAGVNRYELINTEAIVEYQTGVYSVIASSVDLIQSDGIGQLYYYEITADGQLINEFLIENELSGQHWSANLIVLSDSIAITADSFIDSTGQKQQCLTKFNTQTNEVIWRNYYGSLARRDYCVQFRKTFDDGYIIIGQSVDSIDAQFYLVKTDKFGNQQWDKYYGGAFYEAPHSLIQTLDSGFILFGWTQSFGNGQRDFYLVKTDSIGNQEWQKTYGSSSDDVGIGLTVLADGNYLLTGASGGSGSAGVLKKINTTGDLIWSKNFTYPNQTDNNLYSTIEINNGDLVSVGLTHNTDDEGFLVKTDGLGNVIWQRKYNKNQHTDLFYSIISTNDNGFLLGGQARNSVSLNTDAWLLKVDSLGCAYENCTVGIEEVSKKVMVDVWPNPVSEVLNIELQDGIKNAELRMQNLEGQVVYARPFDYAQGDKMAIEVSGFANGVYLLTLENEELRTTVKIVVQH